MSDTLLAAVLSLVAGVFLLVGFVAITFRNKDDLVITWRGFGVTFEIKPCAKCDVRTETTIHEGITWKHQALRRKSLPKGRKSPR